MTALLALTLLGQADFPIVYLRAPRDPAVRPSLPEVTMPFDVEPGTDLVLLQPDGAELLLVDAGDKGAAFDPYPEFDGTHLLYAFCPDVTKTVRGNPVAGIDIYRMDITTGQTERLTNGDDWEMNSSAVEDAFRNSRSYFRAANMGPCPLPGGKICFTSTRSGYLTNGFDHGLAHQLYVMDVDGRNVEKIGHLNLGSALHPFVLTDGKILFSSAEGGGWRDGKQWGLWTIHPDGRVWEPAFSAFTRVNALHFHGERSDRTLGTIEYYHKNNNGFGLFVEFQRGPFGPPVAGSKPEWPKIESGVIVNKDGSWRWGGRNWPFQPWGAASPTPFSHERDHPASLNPEQSEHPTPGVRLGKVTHPSPTPGNGWLLTYASGDDSDTATYDAGIYTLPASGKAARPWELIPVVDRPEFHEYQARALVPYAAIYGIAQPGTPVVPDMGVPDGLLPAGTPFGLIGSSGVYARESAGANRGSNWDWQGSDSELPWTNADIAAIRIVGQAPTPDRGNGKREFQVQGNERLRILGEVPLRKADNPIDAAGDPDTSFLARVPANVPFTFQLIGHGGDLLSMAQTWHQVRPGEVRTDCRGCHAHHEPGIEFSGTAASKPGYAIADAIGGPSYSWDRDVLPILAANCYDCHGPGVDPPAGDLVLSRETVAERVVAFRSRESTFIDRVTGRQGPRMPLDLPPLEDEAIRTLVRWVDLGAGHDTGANGYLADDQPPTGTLVVAADRLLLGMFDESGLRPASVISSWRINDRAPGENLFGLFTETDHVWSLAMDPPISGDGTVKIRIEDQNGNVTWIDRHVTIGAIPEPGPVPTPDGNKAKLREIQRLAKEVEDSLP